MRSTFRVDIPSLFGLPALFLLFWLATMPFFAPELPAITYAVMAGGGILGIVASIVLREACVLLANRVLRVPGRPILLYIWGGVPTAPATPAREACELLVATAASILAAAALLLFFIYGAGPEVPLAVMAVVLVLVLFNALIALVGMLPFYPLRCGRLIVSLIARRRDRAKVWAGALCVLGVIALLVFGGQRLWSGMPLTGLVMAISAGHLALAGQTHIRKQNP